MQQKHKALWQKVYFLHACVTELDSFQLMVELSPKLDILPSHNVSIHLIPSP